MFAPPCSRNKLLIPEKNNMRQVSATIPIVINKTIFFCLRWLFKSLSPVAFWNGEYPLLPPSSGIKYLEYF